MRKNNKYDIKKHRYSIKHCQLLQFNSFQPQNLVFSWGQRPNSTTGLLGLPLVILEALARALQTPLLEQEYREIKSSGRPGYFTREASYTEQTEMITYQPSHFISNSFINYSGYLELLGTSNKIFVSGWTGSNTPHAKDWGDLSS